MFIDADDFGVNFIGMKTLEKIEEMLKVYHSNGVSNVVVDLRGKGINKEYSEFLAYLKHTYKCKFRGIGNKKYDIEAYIMTGYFIKQKMGVSRYVEWFQRRVEQADFPLMILDNRLNDYRIVPMNIIQPIEFDANYFYYNVIKTQYLEPVYMERALTEGVNIFTRDSIRVEDIADARQGFRFAGTYRERCIIDIFEDILTGRARGYMESDVG